MKCSNCGSIELVSIEGKFCRSCGKDKPLTEFYINPQGENKVRVACKECFNKATQERKKKVSKYINNIKETNPCVDCGLKYPYYIMQFDHVRGTKVKAVSDMIHYSFDRVIKEIEKCDLVCANCHAKRTFLRLGIGNHPLKEEKVGVLND